MTACETFWQYFQDICKAVRGVIHCSPRELVWSSRMDVMLLNCGEYVFIIKSTGIIKLNEYYRLHRLTECKHPSFKKYDADCTFSLIYLFYLFPNSFFINKHKNLLILCRSRIFNSNGLFSHKKPSLFSHKLEQMILSKSKAQRGFRWESLNK